MVVICIFYLLPNLDGSDRKKTHSDLNCGKKKISRPIFQFDQEEHRETDQPAQPTSALAIQLFYSLEKVIFSRTDSIRAMYTILKGLGKYFNRLRNNSISKSASLTER